MYDRLNMVSAFQSERRRIELPFNNLLFHTGPIEAVQQFFGLGHALLFEIICLPGDVWGMVMVLALGRWLWGRETCYLLLGTIIVATLTKQVMTLAFGVPRPEGPEIVVYHDIGLGRSPAATSTWRPSPGACSGPSGSCRCGCL